MVSTKNFKTRTAIYNADNPSVEGVWSIALDIGCSAVKGYSVNHIFSYPSFIREANLDSLLSENIKFSKDTIQYKDDTLGTWDVGNRAILLSSDGETYGSDNTLYSRNRYSQPMFLILARVGLAIGLSENRFASYNGEKIKLQTGLPIEYVKSDTATLKAALSGRHRFDVRFAGSSEWRHFDFELSADDIGVMSQPVGSFWCSVFDNMGNPKRGANQFIAESSLIFDGGFGTLDVFSIKHTSISSSFTYPECGMREVFKRTSDEILQRYQYQIPIPFFQKYLDSGEIDILCPMDPNKLVDVLDPDTFRQEKVNFTEILEKHSKDVFKSAIKKVLANTNNLADYQHFIITGGTGAAWSEWIHNSLSPLSKNVIDAVGDENEKLSAIYNDVRGYYMSLINSLQQLKRKRPTAKKYIIRLYATHDADLIYASCNPYIPFPYFVRKALTCFFNQEPLDTSLWEKEFPIKEIRSKQIMLYLDEKENARIIAMLESSSCINALVKSILRFYLAPVCIPRTISDVFTSGAVKIRDKEEPKPKKNPNKIPAKIKETATSPVQPDVSPNPPVAAPEVKVPKTDNNPPKNDKPKKTAGAEGEKKTDAAEVVTNTP